MSGGTALVPELRFPGFVETWEEKQIGFFISSLDAGVSVNSGDRPAFKDEKSVLKTSCVTLGTFDLSENKVVNEPSEIFRLKEPVKAGTIIISRMNTPQLVGANAFVTEDAPNVYLPDRLWAAKISEGGDPAWIGYVLSHPKIRSGFTDRATGTSGSMKNLSKEAVLSLPIFAPDKSEQQKIAAFLDAVSKKVALLTEKRDGLVAYKRGVMQRLFSGALRFTRPDGSAFPDWEERKLGDIIKKTNSGLSQGQLKLVDEGFPVFGASGLIGYTADFDLNRPFVAIVKDGAGVGNIYNCPARSSAIGTMDCLSEKGDAVFDFIYNLLASLDFGRFATGSTIPHIYFKDYSKLVVPYPHPDEQAKIAEALSALDAKIDAVRAEISQMETFKKGLLQKMFV